MARTLFPDILSAYKLDIKNEIKKLHQLLFIDTIKISETLYEYNTSTLYKQCGESFLLYKHRGTILSLKEFDHAFGFNKFYNEFNYPDGGESEYLIDFCEYVYNLLRNISFDNGNVKRYSKFVVTHIEALCKSLNHIIHDNGDGMYYIVPSNEVIDYVCEKMGNDVTQLIRVYSHHTTKGNLAKKQQILSTLCKELEPYRKDFPKINMSKIADNVFCGANNCDIRHNNSDQEGNNYCTVFAGLTEEEKESIYDNMFGNIIVLLSAKIEFDAINDLDNEISRIKRK